MVIPAQAVSVARFENPLKGLGQFSRELSGINAILQDRHGFIWLAGENGLGRYDGQSLKLYQNRPDDPTSLPSNYVWDLALDNDAVMWVASRAGLSRYDVAQDSFEHIASKEITALSTLAVDADNNLYLGATKGLFRVSADRQEVRAFFPDPPIERSSSNEEIRDIEIMPDGKVWLATAGMGVAIFDPHDETFSYLLHRPDDSQSPVYNDIKTIELDSAGNIWLGTYGRGISVYNPHTQKYHHYPYDPDNPRGLHSGEVTTILRDRENEMWITLDHGGLARFDSTSDSFEHFLHDPSNPATVVSNQLRTIFEDRNSDLWIGAFPSGVSFYNRSKQIFRTFHASLTDPDSLSNNAVTSIFADRDGTLWVGTEGGLNRFNADRGTFTSFHADPNNPQALMGDAILAIEEDFQGNLWIGTWAGGLHRFDRTREVFHRYLPKANDRGGINSKFIWDIEEDNAQNLWVATQTGGLNRYISATDSFVSYRNRPEDTRSLTDNFIWDLMVAKDNALWLGTLNGLDRLADGSDQFEHFPGGSKDGKSVSGVHIRSIFEDSRGKVWVGTQEQGVSIFDPESQSFQYLDVQQGLPSTTVTGIIEDDNGDLWLMTTNGLVQVTYPALTLNIYSKEHGLAGTNFNRNAAAKDAKGNLYFGSTEGLSIFHPDDLISPTLDFPIHLTRFRILNKDVPIGDKGPLKSSIVEAHTVRLTHRDIMFSFDFAALNYRSPAANEYAYRLDGFDRDWNYIDTRSTATYTNIEPGTYTFRVKARNRNSGWVEKDQALTIIIDPAPWRTWWAYLGYVLVVALGIYLRREHRVLRRNAESYKIQSVTDSLTQLYNRAGIAQVSSVLFAAKETRKDLAVMMVDIDNFKSINDNFGHDTGDLILSDIARLLSKNVRRGDYVGRWGGEEFILLCPSADATAARTIAEKLRAVVENHSFSNDDGAVFMITVSIGLAITEPDETFEAVLKRADVALYEAKAAGRNQVCFASPGSH